MNTTTCAACTHSRPTVCDDDTVALKCHRYPPSLLIIDGELWQCRPDADEPCGEYQTTPTEGAP